MPRVPIRLALALALAGCGGNSCERLWYADRDGDGHGDRASHRRACEAPRAHVATPDDCDDRDSSIHPGAAESCDGIDQDCDGVLDPDARTWFADADHDGFGTTLLKISACGAPAGFTDLPGDCDDAAAGIHPGAPAELCDGRDQDCDGLVDEGAPGTTWWAPDLDYDGQGNERQAELLCTPPYGWVPDASDCADQNPLVGWSFAELCDGIDNDCDIAIDELEDVVDPSQLYVDDDGDGFGDDSLPIVACGVPPGTTLTGGDCDDGDDEVSPAATEVCNAQIDDDCDALADDLDPTVNPATLATGWLDADGDGLGDPDEATLACELGPEVVGNEADCDDQDRWIGTDLWLADADADGIGAGTPVPGASCAPPSPGMVNAAGGGDCEDGDPLVRPRLPDGCGDGVDQDCTGIDPACRDPLVGLVALEDVSRAWSSGAGAVDAFGSAISSSADLDGDGLPDVAVGSPGAGEVRLLLGPFPEVPGPAPRWQTVAGTGIGGVVAVAPDATGDGRAELLVGVPDVGPGAVYLLTDGGRGGALTGSRAAFVGTLAGERVGAAVVALPDLDGSVAIGAPGAGGVGRILVFGLQGAGVIVAGAASLVVTGVGDFGAALSPPFDADGDGVPELAIGAPTAADGGADSGAVHLVDPEATGSVAVVSVETARLVGELGAHLGSALAAGGDLDGDGLDDLAAAAPDDAAAGLGAGRVFVFADPAGTSDAAGVAAFLVDGDGPGSAIAQALAVGDLDGDGADDLLLGVEGADLAGADAGAVYAFLGPLSGSVAAAEADVLLYGAVGEHAGSAVTFGDSDADGRDDLWVGSAAGIGAVRWVPGP